jgi:selenocysteine-specific elongation factor
MTGTPWPLTLGTAGHIDHGKTTLVRALTGVDTDRLPEEKARGITITLGFAPLRLPGGRVLSVVDVPGHERLIRVMVSGATGIDLFLLVIAADDGIMPQTREHVRVLQALGVKHGVVAITKADVVDPDPARGAATALLPGAGIVACSARTGAGIADVAAALERAAGMVPEPRPPAGPVALHVDRVFTITGAGTIVTGTLWSGTIRRGQRLRLLPQDEPVRVRRVQVHDIDVSEAPAGQRVAVNLVGATHRQIRRGDLLAEPGSRARPAYRIEVELGAGEPPDDRERVQLHHGTRDVPARAVHLGDQRWQMRAEQPLLADAGDRVVVRRISPPDTLGGAIILTTGRDRHAAAMSTPAPPRAGPAAPTRDDVLDPEAEAVEQRLRAAGHEPPSEAELGEQARHLAALRAVGRAVRVGASMHAHPDAVDAVADTVRRIVAAEGSVTLARLRDELDTSRRYAQALLEHLDATRVTRRLADDRRVLRRRASG